MSAARPAIWISRLPDAGSAHGEGPLAGVTVGVKDNIDVAGLPTTAGCPEFASVPERDAACVARLRRAGAAIVGKTNMDQFATGLVGTRTPYGALSSVADPAVVSGGSSSGSAVAVALGECDIALGTDTAGSGRVPAALNGVVGLKPTRGLVSTEGVVPACRTLDCVSVFARSVGEARLAVAVMADGRQAVPAGDPLVRLAEPRIGVFPEAVIARIGGAEAAERFAATVAAMTALGARIVEVDSGPFAACGDLLYGGPWVAERDAAVGDFIRTHPDARLDPMVREVILAAGPLSAVDAFRGQYLLDDLIAETRATWAAVDLLAMPTIPAVVTHEEVAADPHGANARLGEFTRFVNLMNLCAVSIPFGTWSGGVPFGLQLVGRAGDDAFLCDVAERIEASAAGRRIRLAVVGAHLRGQPLNPQLTGRGARLVAATRTAAAYRLFRLAEAVPPKPGLVHIGPGGAPIEVEVWELEPAAFGDFVAEVPPPLAIGTVTLADGTDVCGFVCEPRALEGAVDITAFGGWRAAIGAETVAIL